MCIQRLIVLTQQLLLCFVLQQASFLLHQDTWVSKEGESQQQEQQSTDDKATPPGTNPLGVTGTDEDLVAKAVHIVLQQQRT